ncbi:DUF5034 domain-containing protein [Paraflavitalea soli]|uniref:DUF5034 domain-containing protein n=1 Tax=Paraflavitalea soli TaxID=2315862 RepID=A0A3B7MPF3_9BACT|nr:DUF5034 domain-containing protein [Paraflavitalea soli]AXY75667.1 DUF5034 domain-containing protein [Paraflavitalea soli]
MKKVIFLLLLPLLAEAVVSCCNCLEPVIQHYTNKTISVSNLDNSAQAPIISLSNTVIKKAYGIRVQLVREKLACLEKRQSLFISSAYAFDCRCPPAQEYRPKDSIVSVKIYTQQAFDNTHTAGSDLSVYFKVYKPHYFTTIDDYVTKTPVVLFDSKELQPNIDFLLMTPPAMNVEHKFKIQLILSDGRILEGETPTVKLI